MSRPVHRHPFTLAWLSLLLIFKFVTVPLVSLLSLLRSSLFDPVLPFVQGFRSSYHSHSPPSAVKHLCCIVQPYSTFFAPTASHAAVFNSSRVSIRPRKIAKLSHHPCS
ncbi:uncharacterized protein BKA55DRAFT_551564 [Fusarium redolens]|uniref:Uncharacterized protein n=1 Tax=Fusarium redolens TaxID=48865 RepID=A0A9P9R9B0_FUSRE|nr:uncharacterized protein BKA55DRAFT_551564 [Fusarium redolens]KAH7270399.1 hypothetical protein BKA55DRAFT_551564 [Fusarium redolens]